MAAAPARPRSPSFSSLQDEFYDMQIVCPTSDCGEKLLVKLKVDSSGVSVVNVQSEKQGSEIDELQKEMRLTVSDELQIQSAGAFVWFLPATRGTTPQLAAHSALVMDTLVVVFGGTATDPANKYRKAFSDLYTLHSQTLAWKTVATTGDIPPRFGHTATRIGNRMFVFGGSDGHHVLNDLWVVNVGAIAQQGHQKDFVAAWEKLTPRGTPPAPRFAHQAVAVGSKFYIIGGWSGAEMRTDILEYDTEENTWKSVTTTGPFPAVCHATSFNYKDKSILVLFGTDMKKVMNTIYQLDLATMTWKMLETDAAPRKGCTSNLVGDTVFLLGGGDKSTEIKHLETLVIKPGREFIPVEKPLVKAYVNHTLKPDLVLAGLTSHTTSLVATKLFLFASGGVAVLETAPAFRS